MESDEIKIMSAEFILYLALFQENRKAFQDCYENMDEHRCIVLKPAKILNKSAKEYLQYLEAISNLKNNKMNIISLLKERNSTQCEELLQTFVSTRNLPLITSRRLEICEQEAEMNLDNSQELYDCLELYYNIVCRHRAMKILSKVFEFSQASIECIENITHDIDMLKKISKLGQAGYYFFLDQAALICYESSSFVVCCTNIYFLF